MCNIRLGTRAAVLVAGLMVAEFMAGGLPARIDAAADSAQGAGARVRFVNAAVDAPTLNVRPGTAYTVVLTDGDGFETVVFETPIFEAGP